MPRLLNHILSPYLLAPAGGSADPTAGGGLDIEEDNDSDTVTTDEESGTTEDRGDEVKADPEAPGNTAADGDGAGEGTEVDGSSDGGKKHQGSSHVPIGRFNEVNNEKKHLAEKLAEREREIAELRKGKTEPPATPAPTQPPFDEGKKELDYAEAMAAGEFEKAAGIRKEINAYIRAEATATATETMRREQAQRNAQMTMQDVANQAVTDYPYLDTADGAEAMELIMATRDGKIAQGMDPAKALREAVAKIAPKFAPAAPPSKDLSTEGEKKDTRFAAALKRGAADSLNQPPNAQAGVGNRTTAARVNVEEMSEAQFDALPDSEKKKLRGDF